MKNRLWACCFFMMLIAGFNVRSGIIGEETDCSQWEPSRQNPAWNCIKASDWEGTCVPAWLFQSWNCLELDTSAMLCDEDISYNMTVYISNSNVNFDCNDQVIDHDWEEGDTKHSGIRIPQQNSVSNISMQDCTIRNVASYGVNLKRFLEVRSWKGPWWDIITFRYGILILSIQI